MLCDETLYTTSVVTFVLFGRLTGRGLMVLGPVMQLCWCFSLLAINEDSEIFQYTFAVLNVGQVSTQLAVTCVVGEFT